MPHVLATSAAEPDSEFPTLEALGRHILAERDRRSPSADIRLGPAVVGRDALPNGVAIAVRLLDGSNGGRGQWLGYAFCEYPGDRERDSTFMARMQDRLMTAIAAAAPPLRAHVRAA